MIVNYVEERLELHEEYANQITEERQVNQQLRTALERLLTTNQQREQDYQLAGQ